MGIGITLYNFFEQMAVDLAHFFSITYIELSVYLCVYLNFGLIFFWLVIIQIQRIILYKKM